MKIQQSKKEERLCRRGEGCARVTQLSEGQAVLDFSQQPLKRLIMPMLLPVTDTVIIFNVIIELLFHIKNYMKQFT